MSGAIFRCVLGENTMTRLTDKAGIVVGAESVEGCDVTRTRSEAHPVEGDKGDARSVERNAGRGRPLQGRRQGRDQLAA